MFFKRLFKQEESLISIDIGQSSVKLIELDLSDDERPELVNIATAPLKGDVFSNNVLTNISAVAEIINGLIEANNVADRRIVTAVPSPSVFTKRIKVPYMEPQELRSHINFEAGNFIPHNINAVRLDYHVLGQAGKNQLDVLVVAVKNEIVESFLECFTSIGLDVAVVDIDHFALQNAFELSYPELVSKTVGLVNIGARYSTINICKEGNSLFTGDIPVGGRILTEAIGEALGISVDEAENIKRSKDKSHGHYEAVHEVLDLNIEYVASEFNRQLSFFWNASGSEEGIDSIMVTGGGTLVPGLLQEISEKTGIECVALNALKGIECGESFDKAYLEELSPQMAIAIGMGIRQPGDRLPYDAE